MSGGSTGITSGRRAAVTISLCSGSLSLSHLLRSLELVEGEVLEEGSSRWMGEKYLEHFLTCFWEELLSVSGVGDGFAFLGVTVGVKGT